MSEPEFQTYRYSGPVQSVRLRHNTPEGTDNPVIFEDTVFPGNDYLLPTCNTVVKGWKALGLISEKGE
ncbi:hypothetical protein [Flexibacterium corallicola]|uniref:hypothetical protein n=1 Tax=Flexibacterium corallicola TaxID=3037259 RepID=UPI00286F7E80|nr:hypothetical protein [Pseudovibrio sp. M1P-2-3]